MSNSVFLMISSDISTNSLEFARIIAHGALNFTKSNEMRDSLLSTTDETGAISNS